MARFLADENFPFPVIEALRHLGEDVVALSDLGKAGQRLADHAVLALASRETRAVLTLNRRDFVRLHRAVPNHAGIVVCTVDLDFDGQAERIQVALAGRTTIAGQLIRVNRGAVKIR
ncbi:MAG: DUF5615 family PIN-like protein [Acidobacteria bacterium]|nr:DUF5615 family PIN-like protein [Acidobacteriota bacterium]